MLTVMKFGGSSVADLAHIRNVAQRCIEKQQAGSQVVVVLSAMGKTTDGLIATAKQITEKPSRREMDMLLATGEQVSVSLMAITMIQMGVSAVSLNAWQVPMHTTSDYQNARFKRIDTERIRKELDDNKIVIVTGFQGLNKYDDITTLGRGGSDTSAVALAASLGADLCEIYTDVNGVYTADPRIVKNAQKLDEISYDEILELASLGANVLHNRSVEMAKKYNVNLEVKSSFEDVPGTIVKEASTVEKMLVRGVTRDNNIARIALMGLPDEPGKAFSIFTLLAKKNINVDIILQSIGRGNTKDISFTVSKDNLELALSLLNENMTRLGAHEITHDDEVSKVSIVGSGMVNNPGVAALMFEALYDADINIQMISTSEIKVSVLVDKKYAEKAVNAIHDKFKL